MARWGGPAYLRARRIKALEAQVDWWPAPAMFGLAALVAWLTERARKSGRMRLQYGEITRSQSPGTFRAVLVGLWALVALLAAIGLAAAALEFTPHSS